MSEVIVIGWVNHGRAAVCGETMKNQLMIRKLEEFGVVCHIMDFYHWRRHPWVILRLLVAMLTRRHATILFSTSAQNVYGMMRLMKRLGWKQRTIHWVIGGSLGDKVHNGTYRADVIGYIGHTLVESQAMVEQLEACGVKNVLQVPNFKPIPYLPTLTRHNDKIRFVFLSRIMPEKGCDYILESLKMLNEKGHTDAFEVDFYGKVAESYKDIFEAKVAGMPNVHYAGFLNLMEQAGYDTLAQYDMMLFPTYWKGEGFAGVFIDAFVAGLPILASDWAHNREFLEEGRTALFVPVHNVPALADKMEECLLGKHDLQGMAKHCQQETAKYDVNNVITKELLKKIELCTD